MQHKGFKHVGRVISIKHPEDGDRGEVRVVVDTVAACEGCKARSHCASAGSHKEGGVLSGEAGSESRIIRVECEGVERFSEGDLVNVSMAYNIGVLAVLVAYVIPLIIFIGMLVVMVGLFDMDQGVAALVTFATLAIYYLGVYLMRGYFESVVSFSIEKQ